MQSILVSVKDPKAQATLQAAAGLMGVECSVMGLELLLSRSGVVADWVIAECTVEECIRLGAHLSRAGINPRLTIIRLINRVWQSYVYHDLPVYASLVLPEEPRQAAELLARMRIASVWARERLRQDGELPRVDARTGELELGQSPAMLKAMDMAARVAPLPVDILIQGETGTGKDTFARWVHQLSKRKGHFVHINCAALPEQLIESELFGVEAGAFTGAVKSRVGKLEYAHEGTLYLDEIDSMPITSQAKLLRALQDRGAERLGGHRFIVSDFRVVASTKLDLVEMVEQGKFRQDLLFRLNVVEIFLPPLRARQGDSPLLFSHFCKSAARRFNVDLPAADMGLLAWLASQRWPGNVRELKAFAERHVLGLQPAPVTGAGGGSVSGSLVLPSSAASEGVVPAFRTPDEANGQGEDGRALAGAQPSASEQSLKHALRQYEKGLIESALRSQSGSVKQAADFLGMTPHALYYRMKQLGMRLREEGSVSEA